MYDVPNKTDWMNHTKSCNSSAQYRKKKLQNLTLPQTLVHHILTHQTWNFKQQLMINTQTWKELRQKPSCNYSYNCAEQQWVQVYNNENQEANRFHGEFDTRKQLLIFPVLYKQINKIVSNIQHWKKKKCTQCMKKK